MKRFILTILAVSWLLQGAACNGNNLGILGHERTGGSSPKVLFTLGGRQLFPVVAYLPDLASASTPAQVAALRQQGFNLVMAAIDYPWLEARRAEIDQFLQACAAGRMPVILELQEWDFWHNWLKQHPEANMLMSFGQRVSTYPDFANPDASNEHLRRYTAMASFAKAYQGKPIVALSIGAYDAYHIPDGETHADFSVPQHDDYPQTWLPYGEDVTAAYIAFLKQQGFTPSDLGFNSWDTVLPPKDAATIRTSLHWSSWNWFRKQGYVQPWLAGTASAVREAAGLPVTVSLDLRTADWDGWATAGEQWAEAFDFILVYYYGVVDAGTVQTRLRLVSDAYIHKEVPIISMMEFSSALGLTTPADLYIQPSIPYVSGFMFGINQQAITHMRRLPDFLRLTAELKDNGEWRKGQSAARAAILLSSGDPGAEMSYEGGARVLDQAGIPFDVVYNVANLKGYQLVYIPSRQLLLARQPHYTETLAALQKSGVRVVTGSNLDLTNAVENK